MELRQGPVGVHLHRCGRSPHHSTGARRRRTSGCVLVRGARCRCRRADVGAGTNRHPRRRQNHRRGRLRLRQVQPYRAEQQRYRLPGAAAQRRGGRVPGPPRRRGADDGHLLRCREGPRRAPRRVRAGRGVTDRVPAAAESRAAQRSAGVVHRPVRVPGPREARRNLDQRTSRRRGGRVVRARAPRAALDARSADPGRRTPRHITGRPVRGRPARCVHRRAAGLGAASRRGARRTGSRRAAEPVTRGATRGR